ncbi:YihY/virulence factor BrkB family protein [Amnibacterium kyonggiense]|uniref:Membrane protein n=1 Tax=Amnibacterium kyonggiense TaxID=595671 RepID=A0A4R7FFP2_9MICO|nr:YihY/virulence factor BrkB family protein [Amnibacterium kyonggiense]TDS75031.1 membrane protein [Amnibacterium kyonggiense]
MSYSRDDQGVRDEAAPVRASGAQEDAAPRPTGIAGLIDRVFKLRPVRVFFHYAGDNGPLIASGMTYQAFFALAGALWLSFALLGFALRGNLALQASVFGAINQFLPGLIGYDIAGTQVQGAIDSAALLENSSLSWSSAISLLIVLWTAVGFLATLRTAIRIMFGLPNEQGNFILLKLRDLGYTVAFGAVVLLTAAITVLSNAALDVVLSLLGLGQAGPVQQVLTAAVALVLLAAIETAMLAAAFRILSGIPVPHRRLWAGSLLGGVALAVLQTLASTLLHFGTNNPVIKGFAVLVGLLVFFNIVCQLILLAAAWVAVGMLDAGIDASSLSPDQRENAEAQRLEDARRLVARANREALEDRLRNARGLARWRLSRQLQREVRDEARRRQEVPTTSEYREAQQRTGDSSPDERQVERAG